VEEGNSRFDKVRQRIAWNYSTEENDRAENPFRNQNINGSLDSGIKHNMLGFSHKELKDGESRYNHLFRKTETIWVFLNDLGSYVRVSANTG